MFWKGETAMPDYEYRCHDCGKTFSIHLTLSEHDKTVHPKCVHCGGTNVDQLMPEASVITRKKS